MAIFVAGFIGCASHKMHTPANQRELSLAAPPTIQKPIKEPPNWHFIFDANHPYLMTVRFHGSGEKGVGLTILYDRIRVPMSVTTADASPSGDGYIYTSVISKPHELWVNASSGPSRLRPIDATPLPADFSNCHFGLGPGVDVSFQKND
jgi:hypothetical protein